MQLLADMQGMIHAHHAHCCKESEANPWGRESLAASPQGSLGDCSSPSWRPRCPLLPLLAP